MKVQVKFKDRDRPLTYAALDDLGCEVGDTVLVASGLYEGERGRVVAIDSDWGGCMHQVQAVVGKASREPVTIELPRELAEDYLEGRALGVAAVQRRVRRALDHHKDPPC